MEDNHAEDKRWDELTDEWLVVYGVIRTVLSYLPLPIRLAHWDTDWEPVQTVTALAAFNRARRELIDAQPLDERHKDLLRKAILDWLLAFDLAAFTRLAGDPGAWRVDGLEHLIRRAEEAAGKVALDLGLGDD